MRAKAIHENWLVNLINRPIPMIPISSYLQHAACDNKINQIKEPRESNQSVQVILKHEDSVFFRPPPGRPFGRRSLGRRYFKVSRIGMDSNKATGGLLPHPLRGSVRNRAAQQGDGGQARVHTHVQRLHQRTILQALLPG